MRLLLPLLGLSLLLAGCGRGADSRAAPAAAAPLLIAAEDVFTLHAAPLSSGPLITGSIQPDRRADLRAEVSSVVLAVLKESGQPVRRGELLVRLDDTAIRDSLMSAEEAQRAAAQAFEQAGRQFQRLQTLRASGMASAQQLEDAEIRRNSTQSDLSAARTRVVQARQQLQRTEARAPFDGIVSDRKVSAGDTAQVGKELLKVIDPRSLRFEGLVTADAVQSIGAGQRVSFRVNGYGSQEFAGKIRLVSPAANAATRQVEVLVDIVGDTPPRLAGLYAEGRIEAASAPALLIPASAVVREGDQASAWRVTGGTLRKVTLALGERDPRRGDWVVRGGLADGDRLLRHPVGTLRDGQAVAEAAAPAAGASQPAGKP
ncbi:efflux RND transporter periplasmic adaptor subunit [Ramlibacter sp.]|uniref:efflux RND transporter periplasmic adaptor subunit n=1 Tax=Ramlibacter sp. TaxID=1917967 RepID=UPI002CB43300|nr:efflux RND transporter periplasmic adaptor subunit [Ramlibacter sp.]HWI83239.1 efflux RND transporter periplasmic adaptor subunit [Ramlibacter sp.]